nr:hypothetical protein [uncultured Mediterraneibacter sp.]
MTICLINFNPHFHKGSDFAFLISLASIVISIHTSTREVTGGLEGMIGKLDNFNPHFHKGSDQSGSTLLPDGAYFNPHFHKGSDLLCDRIATHPTDFNPHFRKGSDSTLCRYFLLLVISIHTSTREVTCPVP